MKFLSSAKLFINDTASDVVGAMVQRCKVVLEVDHSNVVKLGKFGASDLTNLFRNLEGKCSDVC